MAKTLIISVITMIALSMLQVSLAQELTTHNNSPWIRKEAPSQCKGKIGLAKDLIYENPYSTEGRCYLIQTAPFEHDRQYLDRSTALFFLSEWTNGRDLRPVWINYGEKPLPSDCTAWFVGIGVMEYKDVSGALRKIPKVKVVKIRAENELRRRVEKEMWGSSALVDRRTKKEAPPECGQQVSSLHHLVADNPYEAEGKCYFIYSPWLVDRQLLDRNRALYTTHRAYGRTRVLIDFDKIDAPAEEQINAPVSWNAYVMGMGAFQYESGAGKLMTVPKVKVIKILEAMVEKKKADAERLEAKRMRQSKELKQRHEEEQRIAVIEKDIADYQKITSSANDKEIMSTAWQSLVNKYPEAKNIEMGNVTAIMMVLRVPNSETVIDKKTGLIWQKEDNGQRYSWVDAITYCKNLRLRELSDWRLPTITELESIVVPSKGSRTTPQIDIALFPNTKSAYVHYWSATTIGDGEYAEVYALDFEQGRKVALYQAKTFYTVLSTEYVRCVR